MKPFVFESMRSVVDQLALLVASSGLQAIGEAFLGVAVLCALVAVTRAVFGRIPVIEKLAEERKLSEISVNEWCEGGIVATVVGWLLVLYS